MENQKNLKMYQHLCCYYDDYETYLYMYMHYKTLSSFM